MSGPAVRDCPCLSNLGAGWREIARGEGWPRLFSKVGPIAAEVAEKLAALEASRAALEAQLAAAPEDDGVRPHPATAKRFESSSSVCRDTAKVFASRAVIRRITPRRRMGLCAWRRSSVVDNDRGAD